MSFFRRRKRKRFTKAPKKLRDAARKIILPRVEWYAQTYGFKYNRVALRAQRSRWGSCSIKGNLNFNVKLIFLPIELVDYVIVHELCHLRHMNHSKAFWDEVFQILPNAKALRKQMRRAQVPHSPVVLLRKLNFQPKTSTIDVKTY